MPMISRSGSDVADDDVREVNRENGDAAVLLRK
jgi:hypothetical protein